MPADGRGGRSRVAGPELAAAPLVSLAIDELSRAGSRAAADRLGRAARPRPRRALRRRCAARRPPPEVVPAAGRGRRARRAGRAADQGGDGRHAHAGIRRTADAGRPVQRIGRRLRNRGATGSASRAGHRGHGHRSAVGPTLTMMSPNCSGSLRRPNASMGISKGWLAAVGGAPSCPAGTSRFWLADGGRHVARIDPQGGHLLRIEPGPNAVVALAENDASPRRRPRAAPRPGRLIMA